MCGGVLSPAAFRGSFWDPGKDSLSGRAVGGSQGGAEELRAVASSWQECRKHH